MTSPAVWGPSADSSRLEVQLHWRLCRRSWSASCWREAYECQLIAVFMGCHPQRYAKRRKKKIYAQTCEVGLLQGNFEWRGLHPTKLVHSKPLCQMSW